ncbi:MAG: DNA-3-methyladenine glycosylase 2 family protein [Myxococcota bacterium]|nr:DNA-3-methyladenine glycosylase 2 family protein [Myxococcota bacterium]
MSTTFTVGVSGVPDYWHQAKAHLRSVDKRLGRLIDIYEEPPLSSKGKLFETCVHSIVGQQISASAAQAVWQRFVQLVGEVTPQAVLAHDEDALRNIGLSRRKAEYVLGLAGNRALLEQTPWATLDDATVIKTLTSVRGVGPWTAQMVLMFCLLRPDILPLGDIGLIRGVEALYADGGRLSVDEVEQIARPWQPYRTVATWFIWRSVDGEPVEY